VAAAVPPVACAERGPAGHWQVVAVSSLQAGDEDLHYSDGSHRWIFPLLNASKADEAAWSQRSTRTAMRTASA